MRVETISAESSPIAVLKKEDLTFRHIGKGRFLLPVTEPKLKLPLQGLGCPTGDIFS